MHSISASELARNTSAVLDRVTRERELILIKRHHTIVARLSPQARTMTAAQALANFNVPTCVPVQATPPNDKLRACPLKS